MNLFPSHWYPLHRHILFFEFIRITLTPITPTYFILWIYSHQTDTHYTDIYYFVNLLPFHWHTLHRHILFRKFIPITTPLHWHALHRHILFCEFIPIPLTPITPAYFISEIYSHYNSITLIPITSAYFILWTHSHYTGIFYFVNLFPSHWHPLHRHILFWEFIPIRLTPIIPTYFMLWIYSHYTDTHYTGILYLGNLFT